MKRIKQVSAILILLLAGLGFGAWRANAWWQSNTAPVGTPESRPQTAIFTVTPGLSAREIGQQLEAKGLIRSAEAWQWWSRAQGKGGFQAGNYELATTQSMDAIATRIWNGDVVKNYFTIPEGWSLRQMAAYFEQIGFFKAEEFMAAARKSYAQDFPWLPANLPLVEGFLFPDTYDFAEKTLTADDVIRQMLRRFEQTALPLYQRTTNANPRKLSLLEWVTLASIVEREAVIAKERPLIAGVFTKRLEEGMTLGSDPTIEYGLGVQQTKEQPLTLNQVRQPSPYNTYINAGLPPTPIAAPGLASLDATLNPQGTDYRYFMARFDDTHIFSRTLAEHEAAQNSVRDRVEAETSPSPSPVPSPTASPSPTLSPSPAAR